MKIENIGPGLRLNLRSVTATLHMLFRLLIKTYEIKNPLGSATENRPAYLTVFEDFIYSLMVLATFVNRFTVLK